MTSSAESDPSDIAGDSSSLVAGDTVLQSEVLESLSDAVNYRNWICDLIRPHLGDDPLEVGSGLGDYAARWARSGVSAFTVSDLDPGRRAILEERFADEPRVSVREIDVFDPPRASYSALVATNVFEHIENDAGALAGAHRLLRPGGKVVVFVPAFPFALSRFDKAIGHFRRYRRATLRAAFEQAGLVVDDIHHVNAPGLLAWFVGMRLLRMTPRDGFTVRLWDRVMIPVARWVEARVTPPFGQSLIAVGHVPE